MSKEREAFEAWVIENLAEGRSMNWEDWCWKAWQAAKAQAVPEGFVLVSKVATKQMLNAGYQAHDGFFTNGQVQDVYQAMVSSCEP